VNFKTKLIIYSKFRLRVTERLECEVLDKNDVAGNGTADMFQRGCGMY
jgi:hypothetical protein